MVTLRQFQLVAVAVLGLGVATACTTKKKEGGGSSGKEEEEEPSDNTTSGGTTGGTTGDSPCLRLDDTNSDTDSDTDETTDDTNSSSSSDTSSSSDSSTESSQSVSGCGEQNTDTSGGTGSGTGGSYDVGPGIDGCKEQGAVWIAVKATADGKKGACGDPLAEFCCTEDNVYALFPGMAAQLKAKFDGYTGGGFKLYGCSAASGKYSFHFAKGDAGAEYKSAYITGVTPASGVTPPASCPAVTLEDMGFNTASTDTDTDSNTDTSSNTNTGTDTTTGIPNSIGAITDTSETGLVDWLSAKSYQGTGWAKKQFSPFVSTATTGFHSKDFKVQLWFNKTLRDSDNAFDDDAAKHPVNSIAVIELYNPADTSKIVGWGVMAKAKDETGKASWFTAGFKGTPPGYADGAFAVRAMGSADCAKSGCHTATPRDFIKTKDADLP